MNRTRIWLAAGTAAVVLLAGQALAAVEVWEHTRPRLPPLAPVAAGLDQAIAAAVAFAGDRTAVAVSGVVAYAACPNTALANGSRYNRAAALVPAGARTFASPANRLAWRDGAASVIVAASDDGRHITVQRTTDC